MTINAGMNVAEVKALAEHLKSAAGQLDGIMQQLNSKVSSTSWVGPDASKFKNDWWPGHRNRLQQLRTDLEGFGQSAHNNATDQENASSAHDGGGASAAPGGVVGTGGSTDGGSAGSPAVDGGTVTPANRSIADVQQKYDAWATGRFAAGGESNYQCTGWANFRWAELGYKGSAIGGDGRSMAANAPGDVSGLPSLHAMASSGATSTNSYGHVMIVEEVSADGSRIRVSEMNTGRDGSDALHASAREYYDQRWITRAADGTWKGSKGEPISFAALPK